MEKSNISKWENVLNENNIILDSDSKTQMEVFQEIADLATSLEFIKAKKGKKVIKGFVKREKESTTGFGDGFAIPHARCKEILKSGVFILRSKQGVEWKSLDDKPVKVAIALIIPVSNASTDHLEILSHVAQRLTNANVQDKLNNSLDKSEIIQAVLGN